MPRQPRLILPETALHVVQRGNNRSACFRVDTDYQVYLLHLRELTKSLQCRVHAYCLMTNHVHLLLTPPSADACIALMRNLGQRYAQFFNRRYDRSGTLWEGRFRSCATESRRYVLACYRYIEMNPVRAGMVQTPGEYRWSSFQANAGETQDRMLVPHPEFLALGNEAASRQAAYKQLFADEMPQELLGNIRDSTNGGYPLGSDPFKDSIERMTGRATERRKAGRPRRDLPGPDGETKEIGL
jgi:putative transposase